MITCIIHVQLLDATTNTVTTGISTFMRAKVRNSLAFENCERFATFKHLLLHRNLKYEQQSRELEFELTSKDQHDDLDTQSFHMMIPNGHHCPTPFTWPLNSLQP